MASAQARQVKLVEELAEGSWGPNGVQSQKRGVLGGDGGGAAGENTGEWRGSGGEESVNVWIKE